MSEPVGLSVTSSSDFVKEGSGESENQNMDNQPYKMQQISTEEAMTEQSKCQPALQQEKDKDMEADEPDGQNQRRHVEKMGSVSVRAVGVEQEVLNVASADNKIITSPSSEKSSDPSFPASRLTTSSVMVVSDSPLGRMNSVSPENDGASVITKVVYRTFEPVACDLNVSSASSIPSNVTQNENISLTKLQGCPKSPHNPEIVGIGDVMVRNMQSENIVNNRWDENTTDSDKTREQEVTAGESDTGVVRDGAINREQEVETHDTDIHKSINSVAEHDIVMEQEVTLHDNKDTDKDRHVDQNIIEQEIENSDSRVSDNKRKVQNVTEQEVVTGDCDKDIMSDSVTEREHVTELEIVTGNTNKDIDINTTDYKHVTHSDVIKTYSDKGRVSESIENKSNVGKQEASKGSHGIAGDTKNTTNQENPSESVKTNRQEQEVNCRTAASEFVKDQFYDSVDDDDEDSDGGLQIDTEAESDSRQQTDMETDCEVGVHIATLVDHGDHIAMETRDNGEVENVQRKPKDAAEAASGSKVKSSEIVVELEANTGGDGEQQGMEADQHREDQSRPSSSCIIPSDKQRESTHTEPVNTTTTLRSNESRVDTVKTVQQTDKVVQDKNTDRSHTNIKSQDNTKKSGLDMVTTQTELGAVIKIENVGDYSSFSGEQGDILDILGGSEQMKKGQGNAFVKQSCNTPSTESLERNVSNESTRKRKRNETFRVVDASKQAVPNSVQGDMIKKIKQEPVDDYSVYNSFYSNTLSQKQNTNSDSRNIGRDVRMTPAISNPVPTTQTDSNTTTKLDSLSQLSKQVENIPSLHTNTSFTSQVRPLRPSNPTPVVPPTSNVILRGQLGMEPLSQTHYQIPQNLFMMPPGITRIPVPAIRVTSAPVSVTTQLPQPLTSSRNKPPQIRPPKRHPNLVVSPPVETEKSANKDVNNLVVHLNSSKTDAEVASVKNVKLTPVYVSVSQTSASATKTISATSTVSSSSTQKEATFSKTVELLPVSSINIDTVGLNVITELIARKNPIANYKAPPIPPGFCKPGEDNSGYICYECGDVFVLQSSMEQHHGRCSMKITYKCEDCKSVKVFFNKCQFLNHLRGHLNIEKTQAVPIHIKSDSIMIEQLPKSHQHLVFQIPVTSEKTKQQNSAKKCSECGSKFSHENFEKHFGKSDSAAGDTCFRYSCNICHMCVHTMCSLRAHQRLHNSSKPHMSIPGPIVCPECGKNFSGLCVKDSRSRHPLEHMSCHILTQCFHMCRRTCIVCPKCGEGFESLVSLRFHFMEKMDQYYKCSKCPMAFKASDTFSKHCSTTHPVITQKDDRKFKVIYRCHVCDSLIDDRLVLEKHLSNHMKVAEAAAKFQFRCNYCAFTCNTKEQLQEHSETNHSDEYMKKECKKCSKSFSSWRDAASHELLFHRDQVQKEKLFLFCSICGFFYNNKQMSSHTCLSQKTGKIVSVNISNCAVCGETFYNKSSLKNHLYGHKNNGVLVCVHCQTGGFSLKVELDAHEANCRAAPKESNKMRKAKKVLKLEILHPCERCNKVFTTKELMNKHCQEVHGFSMLFPCHLCGLTYESQLSLRKHLKVSHEGKRHVYPCIICRKRGIRKMFSIRMQLEKHLMTKHRLAKNQVDSKIFNEYLEPNNEDGPPLLPSNSGVETEKKKVEESKVQDSPVKRLHVFGDQIFNCAKCSFSCENRQTFLDHLVKHKIDNTKQCRECGLCFAITPSLQKHLFMVHKVTNFEKYCQEEGIELKEEEMNEEDLTADENPPSLQDSPVEDISSGNPLECRVCYREFQDEMKLRSHMRTHGMAFIRNRRRERASASHSSAGSHVNGNESSDSALSNQ